MVITRTIVENGIKYCKCNNIWIVGDNETNAYTPETLPNTLIIPKKVRGHAIKEIGYEAFREAKKLVSVFIEAEITRINRAAFSRCSSLAFINIPPTVTYIGYVGLYFGINDTHVSKSSVTVLFETSNLDIYIDEGCMTYIDSVSVFYCRTASPVFNYSPFLGASTVKIYSPNNISIFNKWPTIDSSKCFKKMRINVNQIRCTKCSKRRNTLLLFLINEMVLR